MGPWKGKGLFSGTVRWLLFWWSGNVKISWYTFWGSWKYGRYWPICCAKSAYFLFSVTERPDMQQFMDTWRIRFLQNKESGNDYFQPAEHYGLRTPGMSLFTYQFCIGYWEDGQILSTVRTHKGWNVQRAFTALEYSLLPSTIFGNIYANALYA